MIEININNNVYCDKIKISEYLQSTSTSVNSHVLYPNIIELLFTQFDHPYSLIESKDKSLYIKKKLIEIATNLEENSDEYYDRFNYNKKMSIPVIQYGIQSMNTISALLYLGDLYNITIVVYLNKTKKKIITSDKNKKIFHLIYTPEGKWYNTDNVSDELTNYINSSISELSECLELDVSTKDIYVRFLGGISNYKASELIKMATERNIPLMNNCKKKIKKELYDDINLYELNKSI